MKTPPEIALLLQALDEGYSAKAWHGPTLRGAIRGIDAAEAARRPAGGRHNVWEIVVHCAYWKYAVRRRILGERTGSFPLKGSNWFARPGDGNAAEDAWRGDIRMLGLMHQSLVKAVAALHPSRLDELSRGGSKGSNRRMILGAAMHDVYHAGQIQLIRRLR